MVSGSLVTVFDSSFININFMEYLDVKVISFSNAFRKLAVITGANWKSVDVWYKTYPITSLNFWQAIFIAMNDMDNKCIAAGVDQKISTTRRQLYWQFCINTFMNRGRTDSKVIEIHVLLVTSWIAICHNVG